MARREYLGNVRNSYLTAKPQQNANVSYKQKVTAIGFYDLCLMYFPNDSCATNATITVNHANGVETLKWNFRKGDKYGFAVKLGKFFFEKNLLAQITISNRGADGIIVADGVGFLEVD